MQGPGDETDADDRGGGPPAQEQPTGSVPQSAEAASPPLRAEERLSFGSLLDGLPESQVLRLLGEPGNADDPVSDGASARPDVLGRYLVLGEEARGGIGVVYRVRDPQLGRDLALKVIQRSKREDEEIVRRFTEEAQIGAQLQHPGIVPVHEIGLLEDGTPYFTMKLVRGATLASLLAARRDVAEDFQRFLGIFEQVCQAVAYAHVRGVLHRDLKPSNVMVGSFGEVYAMDWGLAKVLASGGVADELRARNARRDPTHIRTIRSEAEGSRSRYGRVLGTPSYMSPEQARGSIDDIDERSDVFGLGAVLCEILTGTPPYSRPRAADAFELAKLGALDEAAHRLAACSADPTLVDLATRCLAPEPRDRPRDAGSVAGTVREYLDALESRAREAEVEAEEVKIRAAGERRARRLTLAAATTVLVLLAVGAGFAWWIGRHLSQREAARRHAVEIRIAETTSLLSETRAAPVEDSARWSAAIESAEQAVAAASSDSVDEPLRSEAASLLRTVEEEASAARASALRTRSNRELLDAIERIRMMQIHADRASMARIAEAYAEAFRRRGMDPDRHASPALLQQLLEASIDPSETARCLDGWAVAARASSDEAGTAWKGLLHLARALDPDPLRSRIRRGLETADVDELRKISKELGLEDLGERGDHEGSRSPPPARTVELLVFALAEAGDPATATAAGKVAASHHPADAGLHHAMSTLLLLGDSSDVEASRQHAAAVVALRKRDPHAWCDLGRIHETLGEPDRAVTAYRRALSLPGAEGWTHGALARVLAATGALEDARSSCEAALGLHPDDAEAMKTYGEVLARLGDVDGSIDALRRSVELDPAPAGPTLVRLGLLLEDTGRADEATEAYARVSSLEPEDADVRHLLGRALLDGGRVDDAVRTLEEALRLDPGHGPAHQILALALADRGDLDGAFRHLHLSVRLQRRQPSVEEDMLEPLRFPAGNPRAAESSSRRRADERSRDVARTIVESSADGHVTLGYLELWLGSTIAAIEAFREAVASHPEDSLALEGLGIALAGHAAFPGADRTALLAESVETLKKGIALDPGCASLRNSLAVAYRRFGRTTDALGALRRAAFLAPKDPVVQLDLGVLLSLEGWTADAEVALRKAADLDPVLPAARRLLGGTLLDLGKMNAAEEQFRRLLELDPTSVPAYVGLARVFLDRLALDDALKNADLAVGLAPLEARGHHVRGTILRKRGEVDRALSAFRRALDLAPGRWESALQEAEIHSERGDTEAAVAAYRRALEIDPMQHDTCRGLLAILEDEERKGGTAYDVLVRSLDGILASGAPRDPSVEEILLLGWSRRPETHVSTSVVDLARSRVDRTGRRDPRALGLLARVLFVAGNRAEAVRTLEEATALPTCTSDVDGRLDEYREATLPDLPSFGSVDWAVERPETIVPAGATFKLLRGRTEPSREADWTLPDFDDSTWESGKGALGYSMAGTDTVLEDMQGSYSSAYLRLRFEVRDPQRFSVVTLRVKADDGFVAYLNGREIARSRVKPSGPLRHHATATEDAGDPLHPILVRLSGEALVAGTNLLAVQGLNDALDGSDFLLEVQASADLSSRALHDRFADFRQRATSGEAPARLAYLEGRLLQRSGQHARAAKAFRRAIELDRTAAGPFLRLEECARAGDDVRGGLEELREVLAEGTVPRALASLPPRTPTPLGPASGASIDGTRLALSTSPFFSYDAFDGYLRSHWQLWKQGLSGDRETVFDAIRPDSADDAWTVPRGLLQPRTRYLWRAAHVGTKGLPSGFSAESSFRTGEFRWDAVPVDLTTRFTRDVVANPGDPADDVLDPSLRLLTVDGWDGRRSDRALAHGLPLDRRVGVHRLGDYDGRNVVHLARSDLEDVLIEVPRGRYVQLRFLVTGGGGDIVMPLALEYADGSKDRASIACPDWDRDLADGTPRAASLILGGMDRLIYPGPRFEDHDSASLFEALVETREDAVLAAVVLEPAAASFSGAARARFHLFAITGIRMED